MKSFKNVLAIALFLMGATLFAQTKLTGKVVDENNMPLPGADVVIKGTTKGTVTDFEGKFTLECNNPNGTVEFSYVGYEPNNMAFNGSKDFGSVQLQPSVDVLDEVVIVGVADIAKDRQTPVAVSTIKAAEIVEKLGTQEFPEILKTTPSVYATKSGGGFGDSRINLRGFEQENIAVMINGVPVNDMENSKVYWSNWAGLSDVTSAMQVQRGLGSSKLAISSVGGTINVLTKTSDMKEGGSVSFTTGNDTYYKGLVSYSTGKLGSGLSASVLFSHTQGDGYVDGTLFNGNNYFVGLGYDVNDNNKFQFTVTGAPQWHNQRSYSMPISTYQKYGEVDKPNIKYNNTWGYLGGEEFNFKKNFYHKPVASLNWDLKFNETASLSSVVYASWGRGGGTGDSGKINGKSYYDSRFYNADGLYRFDDVVKWNTGSTIADFGAPRTVSAVENGVNLYYNDSSTGFIRRASMNSHNWYGFLTNFNKDFSDNLSFDFGIDLRTYKGIHYQIAENLLGANAFKDNTDKNNPNRIVKNTYDALPSWNPFDNIKDQEKITYNNDGNVRWAGAFTQIEYKSETVSAFVQGGGSYQQFQRVDYFNYGEQAHKLDSTISVNQKSDWKNILGGNVKGGVNFNINEKHNVFANAGYYSKQPDFNAVYLRNKNILNPDLTNQKILGLEIGYGFRSSNASVNLNLYRTTWDDRFLTVYKYPTYYDFSKLSEIHQGVELEINYKPIETLTLTAMGSVGDWHYVGDSPFISYDNNNVQNGTGFAYLNDVKVGNAAQNTAALGLSWKAFKNFTFDISQNYFDKLYGKIDPNKYKTAGHSGALKLPSYSLADLGLGYKIHIGEDMKLNLRLNVNNLFNHIYISESDTNNFVTSPTDLTWNGIKTDNNVFFGYGRTWNASVRFNF